MLIVIANIIDFIAALVQVCSGTIKQKTKILVVQIIQLLMQACSMLLLGGVTAAASNVLSCYRNYLCYKERLNGFWKTILIGAYIVMTFLLNEQGILGIIPGAVCIIYIIFMDIKDPVKSKLLVTLSFVPWIFYHFALKLYVGAIFDVTTVLTNGITLYSMIRKKKSAG